jgi:hypothetical protein
MNSRSVAIQGIGFGARRIAVQGFGVDEVVSQQKPITVYGGNALRIKKQNEWLILAVITAVTNGFIK